MGKIGKSLKKRFLCLAFALILCFLQGTVAAEASSYQIDEWCIVEDGFEPPENETIVHYLSTGAKPYTKIANSVDELWVGEHHRFTVAANRRTKVKISWYSSDKNVAEIDKVTGELTALSAGTTTITMRDTANKTKQAYELTVKALPVLPELPQEWYTVEEYVGWYGEKTDKAQITLKPEYRYLYEQCSMVKIPDEIDGKTVAMVSMDGLKKAMYSLSALGFTNLQMLQCSSDLSLYKYKTGELFYSDVPEWMEDEGLSDIECTKVNIPEGVKLLLTEQLCNNAPKTVRIPASVKALCIDDSMADNAGIHRGEKTDFTVDGNNTNYYSIFGVLFTYPFGQVSERSSRRWNVWTNEGYFGEAGKNMLLAYPEDRTGSTYRVPEGVERIGSKAFYRSQYLKKIILPDSVTEIGELAFCWMEQNVEIVIPASVTVFEEGHNGDPFGLAGEANEDRTGNITIITPKGSAAEAYAIKYGIKYRNEE